MKKILSLLSALLFLVPSCTTRIIDLTIATNKNINLDSMSSYVTSTNGRVKGETTKPAILFFNIGTLNVKDAIDDAVQSNGPNCVGLSNVVVNVRWWSIILYGETSFIVEGDPIYKK